jgi:hypothetical protein
MPRLTHAVSGADASAPTAAIEQRRASPPRRRNPVALGLGRVASALRGDKYMIDAYPAATQEDAAEG